MTQVLPDVEAIVVAFLNGVVVPPVSTRVPNPRPAAFVRAWRTGGAATSRVLERAQITVQAWGSNSADTVAASDLAQACRTALFNEYTGMPLVRGVEEIAGLYSDPDPATGIARYTFTVTLMVRARRS